MDYPPVMSGRLSIISGGCDKALNTIVPARQNTDWRCSKTSYALTVCCETDTLVAEGARNVTEMLTLAKVSGFVWEAAKPDVMWP